MKEMTPLEEIRHSTAHVLAAAVLRLYPNTKLDIGPPTDAGFYYDFDSEIAFTPEILEDIEAEMRKIIKENQRFERIEVSRDEAKGMILEMKQETYKLGRLNDIPDEEEVSFYQNGEFLDLCAGSHVNYTKKIKAFKLLQIAGSYHRGDSNNKQLQRIYGTAFATKDELAQHLEQIEEAKKRDLHYKILYDPLSIEARRFGLSHRRPKCAFGYILIDKMGTCVEYQRGIPDFDSLLQSLKVRTMRHTDTTDNSSDDELLVGYVDSKIAEDKVRESYRIIDVRTLPEYEADHIPNAIHIPLDDLNNRHPELDPLKELLFVCQTGTRASAGAEFITSIGGQSIFVIKGGMSEWNGERITGGKS